MISFYESGSTASFGVFAFFIQALIREWKSGDAPSPRMAFADKGLNEESIVVHSSGGLDALVRAAFPALPDAQVAAILQKADGNAKALPTRQKHCYK